MRRINVSRVAISNFKAVMGEFFCTYIFIFTLLASITNLSRLGNSLASVLVSGVGTAFAGLVVAASFIDISGSHFNPAVTFGAIIGCRIGIIKGCAYIISQLVAAIIATLSIELIFPDESGLISSLVPTVPTGMSYFHVLFAEFWLTYIYVLIYFVVLLGHTLDPPVTIVSIGSKKHPISNESSTSVDRMLQPEEDRIQARVSPGDQKSILGPATIGVTLGFLAMLGQTVSGGIFNPARVFGPSVISWTWTDQYLYYVGELLGAALAVLTYYLVFTVKILKFWEKPPSHRSTLSTNTSMISVA